MKEADPTSPGPNASRSIDPTKPPGADRIAELERQIAELEAANEAATGWGAAIGARWERIKGLRAELARLRNEQQPGWDSIVHELGECPTVSSPAPLPGPQDVRDDDEFSRLDNFPLEYQRNYYRSMYKRADEAVEYWKQQAALAQSDARPECVWPECGTDLSDECDTCPTSPKRQSDAQPVGSFAELRQANVARNVEWTKGNTMSLSPSFRGNELAGEVGEACNVLKKIERERLGLVGSRATPEQLAEELADVIICADLTAMDFGIDLFQAVCDKFNATSNARGLKTKIHTAPPDASGLVEAAEIADREADACDVSVDATADQEMRAAFLAKANTLRNFARFLRSRAADRST